MSSPMYELPEHLPMPVNKDGGGPETDPAKVDRTECWSCVGETWPCAGSIEEVTRPTKWWRALDADGSLLAETSTPSDFADLDLINRPGVRFERLYEATLHEWREE